jgi:hypothetical protein
MTTWQIGLTVLFLQLAGLEVFSRIRLGPRGVEFEKSEVLGPLQGALLTLQALLLAFTVMMADVLFHEFEFHVMGASIVLMCFVGYLSGLKRLSRPTP